MRSTFSLCLTFTVIALSQRISNSFRIQRTARDRFSISLELGTAKPIHFKSLLSHRPLYATDLLHESYDLSSQLFGTATLVGLISASIKPNYQSQQVLQFIGGTLTALFLFLSGYVALKSSSVRLQFTDYAMSVVQKDGSSTIDPVEGRGGGAYTWNYNDIVNYCFLPNENTPIILYFKETSTPIRTRVSAPFFIDTLPGQVHIFPIISDVQALRQQLQSPLHHLNKVSSDSFQFESDINTIINGLKIL